MRAILLIVALSFCGYSFAELQPPSPTPLIHSDKQQPHSTSANKNSASNHGAAQESSPILKIIQSETGKSAATEERKKSDDKCIFGFSIEVISAVITAIATIVMAIFTGFLWYSTKKLWETTSKSVDLAREEFLADHRPKLSIRSCKLSMIDAIGDHKYSCKFTCFNAGVSSAYIREIGTRLINREVCWTYGDREIHFEINTSNDILESGAEQNYFTSQTFDWDLKDSNWFFVGYIKYADRKEGGVIRKIGFCRRWESKSMIWNKEDNEEYEYSY